MAHPHKLLATIRRTGADPLAFDACRVYRNAEWNEYIVKPMRSGTLQPERGWHFTDYRDDAFGTAVAMLWPLTEPQQTALRLWREAHGRVWKEDLRNAWMRSNYGWMPQEHACELQGLRNAYGPEWLTAYPA